jgi:outer membrane protein
MKNNFFKILIIFFCIFSLNLSYADTPHFIDFTKVLNQSIAGKEAQDLLKKKFTSESKKFGKMEDDLRKEERETISQKKLITNEEYTKKVKTLRKKVLTLQENKRKSLSNIAKLRGEAKQKLLNELNPIIKKYMEDNKIRIVLDKKSILLGDMKLEITEQIIKILNKKVTSLKLK